MPMQTKHLHTTDTGGNKPVLILIHGFPENGGLWREVAPLLADDFRVLCPDLPGAGESHFEATSLSMDDMAGMLAATLEEKEITAPVVIAGHSMGGYVALAFAALFPERIRGLSLVHSSCKADDAEKKKTREKTIRLLQKGDSGKEVFVKEMVPGLFAADTKQERPELIYEQIARALQMPAQSMIRFYEAIMHRADHCGILEQNDFPVQLILGKEDSLIPVEKSMAQGRLADVSFVHVLESGHMGMLEAPHKVADALRDFGMYCYRGIEQLPLNRQG